MRLSIFAVALFASPVALAAQSPAAQTLLNHFNCPVGFNAQQRASSQVVWTVAQEDTGHRPDNGNLGVHVQLDAKKNSIAQVDLQVYYKPIHLQLMNVAPPADATQTEPANTAEQKKTFSLSASGGSTDHLNGDLLLGPVAYISRVTLAGVRYADGTSWHPMPNQPCSAIISHVIPVAAR